MKNAAVPMELHGPLARARRRYYWHLFTKILAPSLTGALAAALILSIWIERRGAALSFGIHAAIAIGAAAAGVLLAMGFTFAMSARRKGDWMLKLAEASPEPFLISTACELSGGAGVSKLCISRANAQLKSLNIHKIFPVVSPRSTLAGILFLLILAAAFLPRLGLFGPDTGGFGVSDSVADQGKINLTKNKTRPRENAPADSSAPKEKPKDTNTPAPELVNNESLQNPPPETRPEPKSSNGEKPRDNEPPPPIEPFAATPKVVPIDPLDGPRANRTAMVLQQKESLQTPGAAGNATKRPVVLDEETVGAMERAAETALARRSVKPAELAFVKKYFSCLQSK